MVGRKRGRRHKAYRTTWGEEVPGLYYHDRERRWRIVATGERFREPDERAAVNRFRAWQAEQGDRARVPLALSEKGGEPVTVMIDQPAAWEYFAGQLLADPARVAVLTGLPGLATFDVSAAGNARSLRVAQIVAAYNEHSTADPGPKRRAVQAFEKMAKFCRADTLAGLSDAALSRYRLHVIALPELKSPLSVRQHFGQIKGVLSLASRGELDAGQIAGCLSRVKAKLYSPPDTTEDNPRPISPDDFRRLLAASAKTRTPDVWRAMLLISLNAALYLEDVSGLKWDGFDLEAGTFVGRRRKRGRCLRVATLWPETLAALKALPRHGDSPYVFVSRVGTKFKATSLRVSFKAWSRPDLAHVSWSHLRDGAYTAASHGSPDERLARLLAGHKAPGLSDKYVVRNPSIVRPACDAVYRVYGPFPVAEVATRAAVSTAPAAVSAAGAGEAGEVVR